MAPRVRHPPAAPPPPPPLPLSRGFSLSGPPPKQWSREEVSTIIRDALSRDDFGEARRVAAEARLPGWKTFVRNMDLIGLCAGDGIVERMKGGTASMDFAYVTLKNGLGAAAEEAPRGVTPAFISWMHIKGALFSNHRSRHTDMRQHLAQVDPRLLEGKRLAAYYTLSATEKCWYFPNTLERLDEAMWDLDAAEELGTRRDDPSVAVVERFIYREMYGTSRPQPWMVLGLNGPAKSMAAIATRFRQESAKCHPDKVKRLGASKRYLRMNNAKDALNTGFPVLVHEGEGGGEGAGGGAGAGAGEDAAMSTTEGVVEQCL